MLGTMPDRVIAQKIRHTTLAVTLKLALLGKLPDRVLAKRFNRPVSAVRSKR
jgi:hypothetical protein